MNNLELDLSSNFIDMDKSVSREEYIDKVCSLLPSVLQRRFANDPIKQQIRVHRDRINFSCPYCGDSMKSSHKKRGNIILEGKHTNFYKCFNCATFHRVDRFFKDFNIDLELEVINYISDTLGNFSTSLSGKYDVSLLLDVELVEGYAIDRLEIKNKFGLVEAKESPAWSWLIKRLQFTPERFLYSPSKNYILILNLTPSGKILGSQKRMFYGENKYLTFSAGKLWELMGKGKIPDEVDMVSQLFGLMQVNFAHPITVFEGPFDSFLFKNSIANLGAHKHFPIDIPVRYWFDDDKDGKNISIELMESGKSVFLWDKFKKDVGLPFRKKWDLNDVKIWANKENKKLPLFDNYFSNDILDMMDL